MASASSVCTRAVAVAWEATASLFATAGCCVALAVMFGIERRHPVPARAFVFVFVANAVTFLVWRHYVLPRAVPALLAGYVWTPSGLSAAAVLVGGVFWAPALLAMACFPVHHIFPHAILDEATGDPPLFNMVSASMLGFCWVFIGVLLLQDGLRRMAGFAGSLMPSLSRGESSNDNDATDKATKAAQTRTTQTSRQWTLLAFLWALVATVGGSLIAAQDPVVRQVTVPLPRLPAALEGFTIVQLSDLHIGISVGRTRMLRTVALANAACGRKCGLFALTGDVVDADPAVATAAMAPLGNLEGAPERLFVTGNHEHIHGNIEAVVEKLQSLGINHLGNAHVRLPRGRPREEQIVVAGVYDLSASRHTPHLSPDIDKSLRGTATQKDTVVMLAHQPNHFHQAETHGVDLVLSGHTHAGQLFPGTLGAWLLNTKFAGFYPRAPGKPTNIYVSPGTHWYGPPARFTSHMHEVTVLTLVRGK